LLFELWTRQRYRPTRDADFLARGENSPKRFVQIFKEICETKVEDDGLRFEPTTMTAEHMTEDADYRGTRFNFVGYVENARIPIQIDLGFGDVITPARSKQKSHHSWICQIPS
jgi:Nucleotidyl transferase AbiEii toxin, Type IV TA system